MTFVKDPLNATTPREIIEYSQDLENRVEDGFEDVADYVVDYGSNSNGKWEKWNSGKLVQRGTVTKKPTSGGVLQITFPIPFIRANAYLVGQALYVSVGYVACLGGLPTTTGVNIYYRDSRNGDLLTDTQAYSYEAVGEWK